MTILRYYRAPALSDSETLSLDARIRKILGTIGQVRIASEYCFNVQLKSGTDLNVKTKHIVEYLFRETFDSDHGIAMKFSEQSLFSDDAGATIIEVGPRMSFTTAWSTHAVGILKSCGVHEIDRVERSRRFKLTGIRSESLDEAIFCQIVALLHDRMTEQRYLQPIQSFALGIREPDPVREVDVMNRGSEALMELDRKLGLAFDEADLKYYSHLFCDRMKRNPTTVELFDMAQSNSEHSRHWFFRGNLYVDGNKLPKTLWQIVTSSYKSNPANSVIAFSDNSSAIRGGKINTILPKKPGVPSEMAPGEVDYNLTLTAETHNFPCGVAPFPGAETGTGGRIRDGHATGRGSLILAGTAAYCVGNLLLNDYRLPWEDETFDYPTNLAPPQQIVIEASNGASDYGNKFGEPVVCGFLRSFGMRMPDKSRREWIKPIMLSGGVGQMDARHSIKGAPKEGMLIIKLGGPAYRIGMGGGAASSMMQGDNSSHLDYNAVQRGDAQMEQKTNRVIRALVELGDANPVISIHDQGAGGNGNVLKEICEPSGGIIQIRDILSGDESLSVLELWGAEFQENDALLLKPEDLPLFESVCQREGAPFSVVGTVTNDGRIVVHDRSDGTNPVDLALEDVLGDMPAKNFHLSKTNALLFPLALPLNITVEDVLDRVLRLPSVGSKRFLTTKVDRSVTGLIARQQCVGPLHTTLSNVAVVAQSFLGITGIATAIGEQPIKGLISPGAMARMSVGESLTNLVFAKISALDQVRASGNWMYAAKLPGEGIAMYEAAEALDAMLTTLGMAIDGGKDSLSMASRVPTEKEAVKSPGELTISCYSFCPDITLTVTPDLKLPGESSLLFIDISNGKYRLGGSALAQVYSQVGNVSPDVDDIDLLRKAFISVQEVIGARLVAAGHDRSDGGLITAVAEMAFAGNCGVIIDVHSSEAEPIPYLFNEELGIVLEVALENEAKVRAMLQGSGVPLVTLGYTTKDPVIKVKVNGEAVLGSLMVDLRDTWEATSFALDRLQANPACVEEERDGLRLRKEPPLNISFAPQDTSPEILSSKKKPRVAIIREEGSNGDREMTAAFWQAGFEPWDVHMSDISSGAVSLDTFRGLAFVGGFSHADTLDSGKGWSGTILFNQILREAFAKFYERQDTFSLGVCNGCQLMALLGWVPSTANHTKPCSKTQPRFIRNKSGRYESRFVAVRIEENKSIMLNGMAGSILGVWVAHGEGRAFFPGGNEKKSASTLLESGLVPIAYCDDEGERTEIYPFNPNGSPLGIASLCHILSVAF